MFQQADLARLREWAGCSDDVTRQRLDSEETGHEDDGDHSNDDDDEDHDDYFYVDEEKNSAGGLFFMLGSVRMHKRTRPSIKGSINTKNSTRCPTELDHSNK